ncbi:hypothetical protein BKA70DRAFT_1428169 [Coprinopsis sp. MPI-PUGE-AT-0042]|nr:hypothetical protein BKA70DRAFT_1428169 [Coprinopsis sp. MPI-PUGE-AT-0042]
MGHDRSLRGASCPLIGLFTRESSGPFRLTPVALEKTIASKPSMAPGRLTTPGCFVTIASSPYPPGRSSTSLRISRFVREERYPTIPLLGARKTVERHHVFQRSDYTSENLFGMTTSTVSLLQIAAAATTTVVLNSFPIDV